MLAHMAKLRQLVVQIVIGTMAIGGVTCLCPAAAEAHVAPAAADAHHHHDRAAVEDGEAANQADCGHEDCEAGCERGSAVSSKESVGAGAKPGFEPHHISIPPAVIPVLAPAAGAVFSLNSLALRTPLRQDTPVRRCDRQLD